MKIPYYGRGPIHLLAVIFCYALIIYAGLKLLSSVSLWIALAFPAGVVLHDFVLFPIYRKANHALENYQLKRERHGKTSRRWINHVRVPVVISFLLLLCYFPIIFQLGDERELHTSLDQDPYLIRWLLVTAALVAGSALAYFLRRRRAHKTATTANKT